MKKVKYFIIILLILLISISVILIKIVKMINEDIDKNYYDDTIPQNALMELQVGIHKETSEYRFFGVNEFINQFLKYINTGNKEAVYGLLDDEYRSQHSTESIIKYINQKGNINSFYIKELYKRESTENLVYYVTGTAELTSNQTNISLASMCFQVCVVNDNKTASIKMLTEEEYQREINDTSEEINEKIITKNEYNTYNEPILTNWNLAQRYLLDYSFKLKYDIEEAFNLLDLEYRSTKFNNEINEFKQYIQENKDILYNIEMSDCKTNLNEKYIEYIIKDVSGNVYTIRRKNVMDYSVLLDNNTI